MKMTRRGMFGFLAGAPVAGAVIARDIVACSDLDRTVAAIDTLTENFSAQLTDNFTPITPPTLGRWLDELARQERELGLPTISFRGVNETLLYDPLPPRRR